MRRLRFVPLFFVSAYLASCSGLSKQHKAQMTSIKLVPSAMDAKVYTAPTFTSNQAADTIGFLSGFGGGLIGGAIAVAVVGGVEAAKSSANKDAKAIIANTTPKDVDRLLTAKLTEQLKQDAFFQSRITDAPEAPCKLVVTIKRYGLEKAPNGNHSPAIYATSHIDTPSAPAVMKRHYAADGCGYHPGGNKTSNAPITTYASDSKLLRAHYEEVAASLAKHIGKAYSDAAKN